MHRPRESPSGCCKTVGKGAHALTATPAPPMRKRCVPAEGRRGTRREWRMCVGEESQSIHAVGRLRSRLGALGGGGAVRGVIARRVARDDRRGRGEEEQAVAARRLEVDDARQLRALPG